MSKFLKSLVILGTITSVGLFSIKGLSDTSIPPSSQLPTNYIVDLGSEIKDQSAYVDIADKMKSLSKEDQITLKLHNYGGSSIGLMYLYNALEASKAHVIADVDGPSFSAGAMLACAADEIKVEPYSMLMYHIGSLTVGETKTSDLTSLMKGLDKLSDKVWNKCIDKNILTKEQVKDIKNGHDLYLFPEDIHPKVNFVWEMNKKKHGGVLANTQIYAKEIDIIRKLKAQDPFLARSEIHLKIIHGGVANAYSNAEDSGYMVSISDTFLDVLQHNSDYEAIVLGHELGHIKHGDVSNGERGQFCGSSKANTRSCETDADLYGQQLANKAGYDGCKAVEVMSIMRDAFGEIPPNEDHPTFAKRIESLKCK